MIDIGAVNQSVDLLRVVERQTSIKRVASTNGGEYAGPCPFCGYLPGGAQHDGFRLQPFAPSGQRWMCRKCTAGKWQDAIGFYQKLWPGLSFAEVCIRITGFDTPIIANPLSTSRSQHMRIAYQPSGGTWQTNALQSNSIAQEKLWEPEGKQALSYLQDERGLLESKIKFFQLGYSPGFSIGNLRIPKGIVIPCIANNEVWYLKIALLPGTPIRCQRCGQQTEARKPCSHCSFVNKYRGVRGNRTAALFNADMINPAEILLVCEGEFDCMIAHQELFKELSVTTVGSSTNQLDLAAWGKYLLPVKRFITCFDNDGAGQNGANFFQQTTRRAVNLRLPEGVKDINDYYLNGGDLWKWIEPTITHLNTLIDEETLEKDGAVPIIAHVLTQMEAGGQFIL